MTPAVPPGAPRNQVLVIGLSDAGLGGLDQGTRSLIERAEVLAGGRRQLAFVPHVAADRIEIAGEADTAIEAIKREQERGRRVVVLASGDPLLYGIGASLVRELGPARVRVLPTASAAQIAFARVGIPWHDMVIISAHGRPLAEALPAILAAHKAAVLTDGQATPQALARALIAAGMEDCRAVVCERLGGRDERVVDTRLMDLPGQAFDALNVLLLLRRPEDVRLRFGAPDGDYQHSRGQMTKAEVRAVTLSKLNLAPSGVLWDIGAGSGALAIEAARLMPRGRVYAIEREADQAACLERNLARHGAGNVRLVRGEAPEALAGLPSPQAVFIGGTGGRLRDVLEAIPRPFVINLALLEHLSAVLERFPRADVVQVSIARGRPMAGGLRLEALNPVFVVSVT